MNDKTPIEFFGTEPGKLPMGTYRFRVSRINPEKHYKKGADGTPQARIPLMTDDLAASHGKTGYIQAVFFFRPDSLKRVADFVEVATGTRPALDAINTSQGFKAQLEKCVGTKLIATVAESKPNKAGKVYVNVGAYQPDSYDHAPSQPAAKPAAPEAQSGDEPF